MSDINNNLEDIQNDDDITNILDGMSSTSATFTTIPLENLVITLNSLLKKITRIDHANESLRKLNYRMKSLIMAIELNKIETIPDHEKEELKKTLQEIEKISNENQKSEILIENSILEKKIVKKKESDFSKEEIFEDIQNNLENLKSMEKTFLKRIVLVLTRDYMSINDIMKKSGVAKFRVAEILNKCLKIKGDIQIGKSKMSNGTVGFRLEY